MTTGRGRRTAGAADRCPVRRFRPDPGAPPPSPGWPLTVPAVGHLLREGLELPAGATVLVGENGSDKSTVLEVLAAALELTANWRAFLEDPAAFLRHLT